MPGAIVGVLLLATVLSFGGRGLGLALFFAGGTYVAAVAAAGSRIEATAPLVALLLLVCGELSAWSVDERWGVRGDSQLAWRRAGAAAVVALAGLAVAELIVALSAVPSSHGLAWTVAGAAAAVGAAGTGILVARR